MVSEIASPSAASSMTHRKSRILIADDNEPNIELLQAYLDGVECDVAVAVDGRDTLDKVASFKPDLILLDVMMPKLSGFEVCTKLKNDPATRGIMVLMVTALNELGDIERAVDAGTDDFLSKPVNKLELLKRVENMLKLRNVVDEVERLRQYIQQMEDESGPKKDDQEKTDDQKKPKKDDENDPKKKD
jgi:two-component system, OmpR family, alkaline phosphatase synthesis response regulator PhoP